jgi:nucleoside-diphosphate-sugar epimerase
MPESFALVTGAGGFIGRWMVRVLSQEGIAVRAAVRHIRQTSFFENDDTIEVVKIDLLNTYSLSAALEGVTALYHFAARVDSHVPAETLYRINTEGTRNLWKCAADRGVKAALYCSSTAVYGLLSGNNRPVTEESLPRAIEPYGRSKLQGEIVARKIAARAGFKTVIIRPVAVFGPGEKSEFGRQLRRAAFSKIFLGNGFQNGGFNFVHVEDVAAASLHLMQQHMEGEQIYNILAGFSEFENAYDDYLRVLSRARRPLYWRRLLTRLSRAVNRMPRFSQELSRFGGKRLIYNIWQPGFDMTYSGEKLCKTGFRFKWNTFEDVLLSCINDSVCDRKE